MGRAHPEPKDQAEKAREEHERGAQERAANAEQKAQLEEEEGQSGERYYEKDYNNQQSQDDDTGKGNTGRGNGGNSNPGQAASDGTAKAYGPAQENNPQEYQQIMNDLENSGVEVNASETTPLGSGAYGPSSTAGQPGTLKVNPNVDISTLGHEYEHFLMDRELGYPGMGAYFENPDLMMQGKARAYNTEIARAEAEGNSVLSQILEEARQARLDDLRRFLAYHRLWPQLTMSVVGSRDPTTLMVLRDERHGWHRGGNYVEGGYQMILPRRIRTERQRADVSAGLRALTGYVLIWKGRDQTTSPPQQHQYPEITLQMRQEVLDALLSQTDLEQHIWIAVGPIEHPKVLVSLLHAELDPEIGARVDLLLSIYERNHTQAMAYDGFGELSALTLVLERLGITRLEVPLPVDADRAGLTYAGWIERTPGVFVWEKPAGAEPSH